jgi:PD-(D/E)XK nuclease superfamily
LFFIRTMNTFLDQSASHIFNNHGIALDDVWVILPTRRGVSLFKQAIAHHSDLPFLAPHTIAVDDFITQASGLQIIDSVSLLFETFEVFRQIDPKVEFEQFIGWASVLLADFDRIDQYLLQPHELFSYLSAAKTLERWQLDLPTGAKTLTETAGTARYFQLFENLNTAYHALHLRLEEQGLAYRGMAYRRLAENAETLVRDNPAYEKLYFSGFNALSRAEEKILRTLVESGKGEMLWDADAYYLDDPKQEAGQFIRKYRDDGWLFGKNDRQRIGRDLTQTPKHIRIIGVANASMQTKVAGKICKEEGGEGEKGRRTDEQGQPPSSFSPPLSPSSLSSPLSPSSLSSPFSLSALHKKTAIILADETLLVPMLYALDESVTELNVTMGLSLRNSLLFTLVDTVFEMQRTVHEFRTRDGRDLKIPKFHHRHVVKVLNHPFLQQYERVRNLLSRPEDDPHGIEYPLLGWIHETILTRQWAYLAERDLADLCQHDELLTTIFKRWPTDNPTVAIKSLYKLIELLREVYASTQDAIETEYLYLFFTLLQQLETTIDKQRQIQDAPPVTLRSFRQFLYELIRQTTIPFTSEGNSQLQVMGMLETRAIDFERVIILSANEGTLPQSRRLNSLIPFDISVELGLPTYRDQEAVMAYHFYRLLQRASDITLIYTTSPNAYGPGKGEPSRFIRQIEHELVPRSRGKITVSYPTVRFGKPTEIVPDKTDWTVAKTPDIQARIKQRLTQKGLYPTALNEFIDCSLSYYFKRVVGINEEEEVEEKMGSREFGDWLHKTLETLDIAYHLQGKPIDEEIVKSVLESTFKDVMKGRVMESGINLLLYDVARWLMLDFQRQQSGLINLTILGTEQELKTTLNVMLDSGEILPVKIAGKIDRIEKHNGKIRIVDYKTGKVELPGSKNNTNPAQQLTTEGGSKWAKARQLWLYKYLFLTSNNNPEQLPVTAGFYSFRDVKASLKENPISFGEGSEAEYITQTEQILGDVVRRLLDQNEPFRKTETIATCEYCAYKGICGR